MDLYSLYCGENNISLKRLSKEISHAQEQAGFKGTTMLIDLNRDEVHSIAEEKVVPSRNPDDWTDAAHAITRELAVDLYEDVMYKAQAAGDDDDDDVQVMVDLAVFLAPLISFEVGQEPGLGRRLRGVKVEVILFYHASV